MADFLSLLQKKTDAVDISKQLRKFIAKQYGEHEAKTYDSLLLEFQQLRDEVKNLQDRADSSREVLLRYALFLQYASVHFPFNDGGKFKVNFSWYDGFNKKKCSQTNVFYEQACVLYNAAAVSSQLAAGENLATAEGPKIAIAHLQTAAGILEYIRNEVNPKVVEKITTDISSESLECLTLIMLTYAQQCVYLRAKAGGMKNATLATLTAETANMYKEVIQAMTTSSLSEQFDRVWQSFFRFQSLYYEALTQQLLAVDLHAQDEIGKEIARLEKAKALMKDAASYSKQLPPSLQTEASNLTSRINSALTVAHDENQKIYHFRVPDFSTLPAVERKRLVKVTPFANLEEKFRMTDPFVKLVPVKVLEARNLFNQRLNEGMEEAFRAARQHREQIKNTLTQLGLPGAILAAEEQDGFPEAIFSKLQKIQTSGGINRLHDLRSTLAGMSSETKTMLEEMESTLMSEEEDDRACRQQYAARWTRMPSPQLTLTLKKQVHEYKSKAAMASQSDGIIANKLESNREALERLELPKETLDQMMPNLSVNAESEFGKTHVELKDALARLDHLQYQEEALEEEVKAMKESSSVEETLMSNQDNLETAIETALAPFWSRRDHLIALREQEDSLLGTVQHLNAVYVASKSADRSLVEREEFIQSIVGGVNKYDEILANIKEGIQFYSNMQELAQRLGSKVDDFVFARKTEKGDLLSDIQRQVAQLGISPTPAPQPQPMPPSQPQQPSGSRQPPAVPPQYSSQPQPQPHSQPPHYQPQPGYSPYPPPQYQYGPPGQNPPPQYRPGPPAPQYGYPPQQGYPGQYGPPGQQAPPPYGYQPGQPQPQPGQQPQYRPGQQPPPGNPYNYAPRY